MKCSTCKLQIEPGSMFCPYCGTRSVQTENETSSTGLPQIEYPNRPIDLPPVEQMRIEDPTPTISTIPSTNPNPSVPSHSSNSYGNSPYYTQAQPPISVAAVISLVLGILSCFGLVFIGPLGGIVAGHMARKNIKESGGTLRGDGLALAGLIISYAMLTLSILSCIAVMLLMIAGDF